MIIARIESLILEQGMDDAIARAHAYVDAGADGIMIHSRSKSAQEVATFCTLFRAQDSTTPIVVVPSSYNTITEQELIELGVNVVIYANHMLRSAYPAMEKKLHNLFCNMAAHLKPTNIACRLSASSI